MAKVKKYLKYFAAFFAAWLVGATALAVMQLHDGVDRQHFAELLWIALGVGTPLSMYVRRL